MTYSASIIFITFSFFFFIFGAVFASPTSKHLCRPEQRDALLKFKNEIKIEQCSSIDSHPKTDSWKNNSDCCSWEGITCNAELGEVIELNLSSSCLYGQFRSNNSFFWLQNLHFLTTLDLSSNILNGPIPSSIGKLFHLSNLIVSNNKIKGQVPLCLWTLPNLEYLELSNNNFISFERSSKHGPSSIQTPSRMKHFFGSNNNFTGKIPSIICGLNFLVTLDLSGNNLNGSIPRCIGNLKSTLSDVNLRRNHLTGGLPEDIFESLRSLDVGHNQIVGKLPRSWIHFSSLEVLNVESNKINDTFPFWLSSLKKLKVLVLRSNVFHGPIHQALLFPELQIIDISNNYFNGTLSADYFMKSNAMSSLGTNKDKPNELYLRNRAGYRVIRILKIFTAIDFSGNKFEGNIPMSIGLLKELHVLNLSNNAFIGHIPLSIGNITALESLDVSQNLLSGEIPQELGNLSYLEFIDVSHNQLSGQLPRGIQFKTQSCSSFVDNMRHFASQICKNILPVSKNPSESDEREEEEEEEKEEVISWKAASIGYGLGIVFGFTVGYILFSHFFSFSFKRSRHADEGAVLNTQGLDRTIGDLTASVPAVENLPK